MQCARRVVSCPGTPPSSVRPFPPAGVPPALVPSVVIRPLPSGMAKGNQRERRPQFFQGASVTTCSGAPRCVCGLDRYLVLPVDVMLGLAGPSSRARKSTTPRIIPKAPRTSRGIKSSPVSLKVPHESCLAFVPHRSSTLATPLLHLYLPPDKRTRLSSYSHLQDDVDFHLLRCRVRAPGLCPRCSH